MSTTRGCVPACSAAASSLSIMAADTPCGAAENTAVTGLARVSAPRRSAASGALPLKTLPATVLSALEDVENAIVAFRQERIKNGRLAAATQSYRKASELAQSLYQSGSSSFLDVLDAERSLYSAEDSLLTSTVAIANNYIALNKALGGGWDGVVDASRPEVVDTQTGPRLRTAAAN